MDAAQQTFTRLYEAHYRAILSYLMRRLDSTAVCQDLTEDVFLVAWRKLDQIPDGEEALYWLYGVARRTLAGHLRKTFRRQRLMSRIEASAACEEAGPDAQLIRSEEARSVLAALSELKSTDQELIRLAYWEELPHRVIAGLLSCSRTAVDVRLHRAVNRLRKAMARPRHLQVEEIAYRSRQESQC